MVLLYLFLALQKEDLSPVASVAYISVGGCYIDTIKITKLLYLIYMESKWKGLSLSLGRDVGDHGEIYLGTVSLTASEAKDC